MSLRWRLNLVYTAILVLVFVLFGVIVYTLTSTILLDAIDQDLRDLAGEVVTQVKAFDRGVVTELSFPADAGVFESAAVFMIAVDDQGTVTPLSRNLQEQGFDELLNPVGLTGINNFSIVARDGLRLRVLTAPLIPVVENDPASGEPELIGYLQIARLLTEYDRTLINLSWMLWWTAVVAVILSLFLGDWFMQSSLRPLYEIEKAAATITKADDLGRRVPDTGRHDEIGSLAHAINHSLSRLEDSFRAQQRFLADISHELRTPLTTIRGNVDLIRRLGEADEESLNDIQQELERMTRLVEDLLLLARADAGSLPMARQPVQLDTIFADVYRQFSRLDEHVKLVMADFDQVQVMGDADRLKQLLINLVSNGIKYTPAGGTVTMSLQQAAGQAQLIVADTGIGIPETDLPYVFDRFYRVDKSRQSSPKTGTGLGLAIVKWIAEAHEGSVGVQSHPGEGTMFTVTLPVWQKPQPATQVVQEKASRRRRLLQSTLTGER
ncbi:MAG: HAMP domain-containing protein [Chloroflexi bacterium]|nr:HAMP domain-containing protein [Chloroflexota bacterium]MBP8054994.1 HAMP domain-containing protein [Chloroflexota bacterium]